MVDNEEMRTLIKELLSQTFDMKPLGNLSYLLLIKFSKEDDGSVTYKNAKSRSRFNNLDFKMQKARKLKGKPRQCFWKYLFCVLKRRKSNTNGNASLLFFHLFFVFSKQVPLIKNRQNTQRYFK